MAVLLKAMCLAIIAAVLAASTTEAALPCGVVVTYLTPCLTYVTGAGKTPVPANCCSGVKALNSAANTTPDRQAACNCLKTLVKNYSNVNPTVAAGLPGKCGVSVPYKISTSTNCATVK